MYTIVEENYIKAIFELEAETSQPVKTSSLSERVGHMPSTTTETLDRLVKKRLIWYQKYKGVELSPIGKELAIRIVRRHRLWECFLKTQLDFGWEEVHEIAEELEHVRFPLLTERLNAYLGKPAFDPHGLPIPAISGKVPYLNYKKMTDVPVAQRIAIRAVNVDKKPFLTHLNKLRIQLGQTYTVSHIEPFDKQITLEDEGTSKTLSAQVAEHILVEVL